MQKHCYIIFIVAAAMLTACNIDVDKSDVESSDCRVVASVDGYVLTDCELQRDMPSGLSEADSATFARMYIDNWVLKQLKMERAERVLSSSTEDIDRLVEDYRQSLIMRRLDQYYVDQSIDLEITDQQIASHYRANAASFKLDHNKVRGVVVKTPRSFRNTTTLMTALKNVARNGIAEVAAIAEKHNLTLGDMSGAWVSFSDFLSNLPTERSSSYEALLSRGGVQKMSGNDAQFYFIILDVARKGDVAPLECVADDIRRRLYSERRHSIVLDYEQELRREAVAEGRVEIADTLLRATYFLSNEPSSADTLSTVVGEPIIVEEIIEDEGVAISADTLAVATDDKQ